MDRVAAAQGVEGAQLIGQFGVGFYSAFMVADRVDVISRRAGSEEATLWSSDGKGSYTMAVVEAAEAPARGTRVIVHLMEDAASFAERYTLERVVKAQSGHVPVPIAIVEKPGAEPQEVAGGGRSHDRAALCRQHESFDAQPAAGAISTPDRTG